MSLTHVWSKGQVTIPSEFRKHLHLEENTPIHILMIGESVVITPHKIKGDSIAKKFQKEMKQKHIRFKDLIADLKYLRRQTNKDLYGF